MANVRVDPGAFTTDVIVELSDSEAKLAAAGGAAAIGALSIPPPFGQIVAAIITAAAADIASKNRGNGVRVIVTVVILAFIVSGWHVDSL